MYPELFIQVTKQLMKEGYHPTKYDVDTKEHNLYRYAIYHECRLYFLNGVVHTQDLVDIFRQELCSCEFHKIWEYYCKDDDVPPSLSKHFPKCCGRGLKEEGKEQPIQPAEPPKSPQKVEDDVVALDKSAQGPDQGVKEPKVE